VLLDGTISLVNNGGFETGSFAGWTEGLNTGGLYIAPTEFTGDIHSGTYAAGMGSFNTDGSLSQIIATEVGQHYTLDFWAKPSNAGSTPANHFAVRWDGATLFSQTNAADAPYHEYTFDVVGDGSSVLEFDGWNNPYAWFLDDVTLVPAGGPPPPPPPVAGSVSINDVSITEGNSGTKLATFTLTRDGGTLAFDVGYTTSNGTATTGNKDYVATSGVRHFAENENSLTISVVIKGDTKVEANETFSVNLSNATNGATIADGHGIGTIVNDDVSGHHAIASIHDWFGFGS